MFQRIQYPNELHAALYRNIIIPMEELRLRIKSFVIMILNFVIAPHADFLYKPGFF